jgi:tRNA (guanine6-N2)-methyltransferase
MNIQDLITQGTFERTYRVCTQTSSLNPAIAYAMNQLAELESKDRVLDPCCGTGTILIERQLLLPCECVGVDIDPRALECARKNTEAYRHPELVEGSLVSDEGAIQGTLNTTNSSKETDITKFVRDSSATPQNDKSDITLKHADITTLKFQEQYFTKIISNLPYGIHSGSREKNIKLYRFLSDESIKWLRVGGKAVFITQAKTLLRNSFAFNESWELVEEIPLTFGGLDPSIFVYQRLS